MKFNTTCALIVSAMLIGGCASASDKGDLSASAATLGSSSNSAQINPNVPASIQKDLQKTASELIDKLNRVTVPSKSKPKVYKSGKSYVATYVEVDKKNVSVVSLDKGSAQAPYIACIQYKEDKKMCTGATKAKAIASTDCKVTSSEYRKEMLHHDGKKWNY